jgi:hypothetical protein
MFGPLTQILGRLPFSHQLAQRYENLSSRRTTRRAGRSWLEAARRNRERGGLWHDAGDQWFTGNEKLFVEFVAHVRERSNLEIGSGPMGFLAPCHWMRRRVVIDPLIDEYRAYQLRRFGETVWTPEIETHACAAETVIPQLCGAIDGSIVSRNALDHTDDPLAVLEAISRYAAAGCYLLIWTDIWHVNGPTIGHRNITRSVELMDKLLGGLGFTIIQRGAAIRDPKHFIEYGRVARKL